MAQDFILNAAGDLQISGGDFVVGSSDTQHVLDIIQSSIGSWKQFPLVGVGVMNYLKSQNGQALGNVIKTQLQADIFSVSAVNAIIDKSGQLNVNFPNGIVEK